MGHQYKIDDAMIMTPVVMVGVSSAPNTAGWIAASSENTAVAITKPNARSTSD